MAGMLGTLGAVSYAGADYLWNKRNPPSSNSDTKLPMDLDSKNS